MIRSTPHPTITEKTASMREGRITSEPQALNLVVRLCQALKEEDIRYCHWKSNNALDRSAIGENDVDLLVSRADMPRFSLLLYRLGFKQARAMTIKQMPGVLDYFGYDEDSGKLVHVHAHYQLVLGHDMTKNYRLGIERAYLESAVQGDLFRVPAPEHEFIVFIVRMILKHSTWDVILGREGRLKSAERRELTYLQAQIDRKRVDDILRRHLPFIGVELFSHCVRALEPDCSIWKRVKTGQRLQATLRASARRLAPTDVFLKLWRRTVLALRRRIIKASPKYLLEGGGAMIAIVGGDGAGKSTAVKALHGWLSEYFQTTTVHMGRPAWSRTTITIRAILKIGNLLGLYPVDSSFRATLNQESLVSPGYPWLLREVCRARDRYLTYIKARRTAANGALVICDRFPVPQIQLMDGPQAERFIDELSAGPQAERFMSPRPDSRPAKRLVELEERYYKEIVPSEMLFVLRVNPQIAVERKEEEDADFVRERSTEIWELNWGDTTVHVIDASNSITEVLAELKAQIWAGL